MKPPNFFLERPNIYNLTSDMCKLNLITVFKLAFTHTGVVESLLEEEVVDPVDSK